MHGLFLYIFLYIAQKQCYFSFGGSIVELLEDLIVDNFPNLFTMQKTHYETLVFILFICYEIYFPYVLRKDELFSGRFVKFIRLLGIWHRRDFWLEAVSVLKRIAVNPLLSIFYSSLKDVGSNKIKQPLVYTHDIYELLINIGFYFLKLPFKTLFDTITSVNDANGDVNVNVLFDYSKQIEEHFTINQSKLFISTTQFSIP